MTLLATTPTPTIISASGQRGTIASPPPPLFVITVAGKTLLLGNHAILAGGI